jgi:hypothetical protein
MINLCSDNHVLASDDQKLKVLNVLPLPRTTWKNAIWPIGVFWNDEYWDFSVKFVVDNNSHFDFIYMLSREWTINNLWGWPFKTIDG